MAVIQGGYYIKARSIQESEIAHCPPQAREIWDWLIMNANYKDRKVNGRLIKRGQCFTSYKAILEGLHWMVGYRKMRYSKSQCETAMKLLTKRLMITTTKTTRGMIVTVVNYDLYQDSKNYEADTEPYNETTMKPQPSDTIPKKDKKGNKGNIIYSPDVMSIGEDFYLYIQDRFKGSTIKLDQQVKAADALIKKYGVSDLRKAIGIIKQDNFYGDNVRSLKKLGENWKNRGRVWMLEVLQSKPAGSTRPLQNVTPSAPITWKNKQ